MDAHLFRLFVTRVEPLLSGARIEKIQEPAERHLSLLFYNGQKKFNLCFRFGRKEPFCFLTELRPEALPRPSAQIMRLRKYFASRRIAAVVAQVWQRKLWLMAGAGNRGQQKIAWLCLDLAEGPSIHFLEPGDFPAPDDMAVWPSPQILPAAMENWRDWPCLTPLLRKNLATMDVMDGAALLADLECGAGDVFLYLDDSGRSVKLSAWPLPASQRGSLREEVFEDALPVFEKAGQDIVLRAIYDARERQRISVGARRLKKLQKIMSRIDEDEKRLLSMLEREEPASLLAANLWRLPKNAKMASVEIDNNGNTQSIALDRRYTVIENMERMFHMSRRGRRGLDMLGERRKTLREEMSREAGADDMPVRPAGAHKNHADGSGSRHVQFFVSADGFQILRGRDAKGNQVVRRLASGHDLWAHVSEGPGAHVIIRRAHGGVEPPLGTLKLAATLAANKSWLSEASEASVMFAEVRHIKSPRSAPHGKVLVDRLWRVMTAPVNHDLEATVLAGNAPEADLKK